jgi:hypothetical protein
MGVTVLAGHPVVAAVLQQEPKGGADVLAGGQHRALKLQH